MKALFWMDLWREDVLTWDCAKKCLHSALPWSLRFWDFHFCRRWSRDCPSFVFVFSSFILIFIFVFFFVSFSSCWRKNVWSERRGWHTGSSRMEGLSRKETVVHEEARWWLWICLGAGLFLCAVPTEKLQLMLEATTKEHDFNSSCLFLNLSLFCSFILSTTKKFFCVSRTVGSCLTKAVSALQRSKPELSATSGSPETWTRRSRVRSRVRGGSALARICVAPCGRTASPIAPRFWGKLARGTAYQCRLLLIIGSK